MGLHNGYKFVVTFNACIVAPHLFALLLRIWSAITMWMEIRICRCSRVRDFVSFTTGSVLDGHMHPDSMAAIKFLVAATYIIGALGAFAVRPWRSFCGMALGVPRSQSFFAACTHGFPAPPPTGPH